MTHRNICPICGSENPEGSEFCQVCKANLQTLPSEMFPSDLDPIEPEQNTEAQAESPEISEAELDNPVPVWLKSKLKPTENKMDFDTYANMLFGVTDTPKSNTPSKQVKPQRERKKDQVYQPPLQQSLIEPPLLEPDEGSAKFVPEDIPGIADFLLQRPARKWDDRKPQPAAHKSSSISLLADFNKERPAKKWDDHTPAEKKKTASQPPLWWQQDNPLVETEDDEIIKGSDTDDPALLNSTSPTKVMNASELFRTGAEESLTQNDSSEQSAAETDVFEPESGSLLSDLMNELNSSSVPLTPAEQQENHNGTVFYSGNHPSGDPNQEQKEDIAEISIPDDSAANAEMLDRILRNIGYEVEGEAKPEISAQNNDIQNETQNNITQAQAEEPENNKEKSGSEEKASSGNQLRGFFIPQVIDNPLIPNDNEDPEEKDADPYGLLDEYIPEKEDSPDEQDIPWDLFGSADMALPQSPEDPEYRTFSRSSLPEDPGSTDYQQRMISSILGKIIQAENFVEPAKEKNERQISLWARIFLSALAICGVVFLLQSSFTDRFDLPEMPSSAESEQFYSHAEAVSGEALVIVDYTPAFHFIMDNAAENLISMLDMHAETVHLAALNPAVMPAMQQKFNNSGEKTVFAGWWPAGVLSIRARLSSGEIPEQVWLLTSESNSVRNWAEQLAVSGSRHELHVMAPEQLKPILRPYLQSGMITSILCDENDLLDYGTESHKTDRTQMALWYLAALVPAVWVCGLFSKMMKAEPKYGRKSTVKREEPQQNAEKETAND